MFLSSGQEFSFYFVPASTLNFNVKEKISDKFEGKNEFYSFISFYFFISQCRIYPYFLLLTLRGLATKSCYILRNMFANFS